MSFGVRGIWQWWAFQEDPDFMRVSGWPWIVQGWAECTAYIGLYLKMDAIKWGKRGGLVR